MFSHSRWIVPFALVGPPLAAQATGIDRLQRRTDSLVAEWRSANAIAGVADSLERERAIGLRDTIAVGALRLIANRSPLPLREAAERAWPVLDGLYGSAAQALIKRPYYILAIDPDTSATRLAVRVGFDVPWDLGVSDLTTLLLANVPMEPPDAALRTWLGGPLRPRIEANRDFARVYVQLVTAPSALTRDCFVGDIPSCRSILGLDRSPELFMKWYSSPGERRAVLRRSFTEYFNRPATIDTWRACMAGADSACMELLRTLPANTVPPPIGTDARHLVAHTALRIGGPESYRRLLADPNLALDDRLSSSAGVSVDSVVVRWRADVIAGRPTPVALPWWGAVAAVGWILVFGGCAMRSSRWRIQ